MAIHTRNIHAPRGLHILSPAAIERLKSDSPATPGPDWEVSDDGREVIKFSTEFAAGVAAGIQRANRCTADDLHKLASGSWYQQPHNVEAIVVQRPFYRELASRHGEAYASGYCHSCCRALRAFIDAQIFEEDKETDIYLAKLSQHFKTQEEFEEHLWAEAEVGHRLPPWEYEKRPSSNES